ncbi:hypothetical protein AG1IA_02537 [Rhizoctonia solani AG-1 IA]|uniref:Uncharacterized protein n=1 Tax=Thanatephorus cucumeris (strain AG1-IA) TaxID=983506 RepID=L8WZL9_THACA|nr:hypothetical protein AG1IA_02537 [Rhizoctonia solani AG-1 IA]
MPAAERPRQSSSQYRIKLVPERMLIYPKIYRENVQPRFEGGCLEFWGVIPSGLIVPPSCKEPQQRSTCRLDSQNTSTIVARGARLEFRIRPPLRPIRRANRRENRALFVCGWWVASCRPCAKGKKRAYTNSLMDFGFRGQFGIRKAARAAPVTSVCAYGGREKVEQDLAWVYYPFQDGRNI